jgi:hypothetical protein
MRRHNFYWNDRFNPVLYPNSSYRFCMIIPDPALNTGPDARNYAAQTA